MPIVAEIVDYLDRFAPPETAAEWDNVGLILGDRTASLQRILTCLTVTPEVVAEAVDDQVQLIVSHHPILFRPVQKLTSDSTEGRMVLALLHAGIAVYSPHTAFDNCPGGINDTLAKRSGLGEIQPLRPFDGQKKCKVVVFVPDADLARVSDAMFAAGAGTIGRYSQCSFRLAGTGTFFGSDEADPAVGQKGRREQVSEWRLEVVCDESQVESVVRAMRSAHSYEEPAFDVYPMRQTRGPGGGGRVGRLNPPQSLESFARHVRSALKCGPVQVVGDPGRLVERVALACGAAGEFLRDAERARADVFLTGEMRFHDYLRAQAGGIALVLPGHYATERLGIEALAEKMQRDWPALTISASAKECDPVGWC